MKDPEMLNQSLKNIDYLLEGEEDYDIIKLLNEAKEALEWVQEYYTRLV
jgi:hypothetical protein